ncbi:hypothetical protein [Paenibacillus alvei]|uniref:Uncharacterized protein n=1 Tax=Paenibacillus alvei TaxID=44250 RepID=A0AAP7A069_PAEAL|nr:hypothetical protein [Paenibacillus alvei]NOJ73159.1 hypothetical protein [Paenibacillus alvei]
MDRKILAAEALAAGRNAKHNLKVIQENPEKIRPGKMENAEAYLNMLIRFSEEEIKNARRAGRTSLRTWFKCLVLSIVTSEKQKRKEGAA